MGAVWGDYDNDGYEDLLLYSWGRPELFHNDGGQGLHARDRAARAAGLGQRQHRGLARLRPRRPARPLPRRLLRRGRQPLEARRHEDDAGELRVREERRAQVPLPQPGRRALRGGERGASASRSRRWALAAVAADLRGTGYPDLFIANDYGVSELFVNEGGRFREVGRETGVGYAPKSGMNASVGDVLNQGRFAIYVSNISEEGILLQGNNLWVPTGGDGTALPQLREPGARDGRRPGRLELRRAVRRPQQRRLPGPLPGQRLRLGLAGARATGTTTRRSRAATSS